MGKLSSWIARIGTAFKRPAEVSPPPAGSPSDAPKETRPETPVAEGNGARAESAVVQAKAPADETAEADDKAAAAGSAAAEDKAAPEAAIDQAAQVDVGPTASPGQRKSQRRRKPAKDKAGAAEPAVDQPAQADAVSAVSPDQQATQPRRELAEEKATTTAAEAAVDRAAQVAAGVDVGTAGSPDQQEIQRRRELVRTLFNDFWDGSDEKPATFADRLNQAEAYLNEQLTARGESWRLDATTRKMLGLPPRGH